MSIKQRVLWWWAAHRFKTRREDAPRLQVHYPRTQHDLDRLRTERDVVMKRAVTVAEEAVPIFDLFQRSGLEIGTVRASTVMYDAWPGQLLLCVGLANIDALDALAQLIRDEITDPDTLELTNRVAVWRLDGSVVAVFLDIDAMEIGGHDA